MDVRQKRIWEKSDAAFSTNPRLDEGAIDYRKAGRGEGAVGNMQMPLQQPQEFCAVEQEPGGWCRVGPGSRLRALRVRKNTLEGDAVSG